MEVVVVECSVVANGSTRQANPETKEAYSADRACVPRRTRFLTSLPKPSDLVAAYKGDRSLLSEDPKGTSAELRKPRRMWPSKLWWTDIVRSTRRTETHAIKASQIAARLRTGDHVVGS